MARLGPEEPRPMGTQHKTCLPGTRGAILQEIRQWCQDPTVNKPIFWLCDVGGSGKSTVAMTMCEEWDKAKFVVVGRFFFSKNARKTSETDDFCSNVADDIGAKDRTIMKEVKRAIEEDPRLLKRGLRHQFAKLIEEPVGHVNDNIILVVDALDECNKEMRAELLSLLLEKLSSMANLKLFITSRPEPDITAILQGRSIVRGMHFKMQGKEERSNLDDITTYVDTHLAGVLDASVRQRLVERSNGLFIWITTAHLELKKADGPDAVETTLKSLLTRGKGGDINQVYANVIRRLLKESSLEIIRKVMGTILTLFEPVSTEALSALAEIPHPELQRIVMSMQSVFRVEHVVEFLHPTFREYLLGEHNEEMRFDASAAQSSLAISVLQTLRNDLKEDICGICKPDEPYPKNADVSDLGERLNRVWRRCPALSYSIKYWGFHAVVVVANENVARALRTFLETGVLHLMEILSLTGQVHLIRNFEEVGRSYRQSDGFEAELCRDAVRLAQRHQTVLEESALHIYSSALFFLPRKTRLWGIYGRAHSNRLPKAVGPSLDHWPSHQILAEHKDRITRVAFSPDGSRIVSGSYDNTLRVWDATTGASIVELTGHTYGVWCLAFSPDGLRIASVSGDKTLRVWDATTGVSVAELKGHTYPTRCLTFSPDWLRIASGSRDAAVRLWDAKTGASIAELKEHTDAVWCLAFSPDGLRIASGSADTTVRVCDATTGASIAELKGHTKPVCCLAFSPDGLRTASGSWDATARVWDATTGASIAELEGHTYTVHCLVFSPDGLRIASGSGDATVRLWDATTGASTAELKGHTRPVHCLAFSPDGLCIASGSVDTTARVWDAKTGASIAELKGHTHSVSCLAFSPDGLRLASGSVDMTVRVWDATISASIAELEGYTHRVECLAFSPDGLCIASGSDDATIRVWDVTTGASIAELEGHTSAVICLAFSPDGLRIASGSYDATLQVWDVVTGLSIAELEGHSIMVSCVAFSPNGLCIASGSVDNTLRLWDATTGVSIAELKGHTETVECLAFSPDGLRIASGSSDTTVRVWDATTGASIAELKGHTDLVWCLAFSPDGLRIVSGSKDKTLRLWDVVAASSLGPPYTLDHLTYHLHFAHDGRSIQLENGLVLDTSEGCLQPFTYLPTAIANLSPLYANVCISVENRELWRASCPHRKYRIPREIKWVEYRIHRDRAAFGLENGQVFVIDFADLVRNVSSQ